MAAFLYHRTSGRIYEIVGRDKAAGTITLKNEMATFSDTYDKDKLKAQGYMPVMAESVDEAREQAQAKIAAEEGEAEDAA